MNFDRISHPITNTSFQKSLNRLFPEKRGIVPHSTVQGFKKCGTNALVCQLSLGFLFVLLPIQAACAGIKIKLVAVNSAEDASKDYLIKYYLPKELKFEDVLDPGGLNLDYDTDQQAYYVSGTINLPPKGAKIIKIEVKDVWKVSKEEVESLKKQIDENLNRLQNTPNYEAGKDLKDILVKQLDNIAAQQEKFSGDTERRIGTYRSQADELKKIKDKIFSVEYWEGKKAQLELSRLDSPSPGKTVTMVLEVENPPGNEAKPIQQQHYLPPEVRPEDIIDPQGFEIRYDAEKKQSYLFKEEELQPGEKERYKIEIKDIWNIPEQTQKSLIEHAQKTSEEIKEYSYAKEYSNNVQVLVKDIEDSVGEIEKSQKEKKTVRGHIGAYHLNQKRLEQTVKDTKKLEDILALVRQKRLAELENSRVRNVLRKLQSLKGIAAIAKALFAEKPTAENAWRVIWMTIVFIAIFTIIHFSIWWQRSKKAEALKEIAEKKEAELKIK